MAKLTRSENAGRIRLTKEERVAILGGTPLLPGEVGRMVWVRAPQGLMAQFMALSAVERGEVIKLGLAKRGE